MRQVIPWIAGFVAVLLIIRGIWAAKQLTDDDEDCGV